MDQNGPANRLTKRQEHAAALVAADTEPDERIAATCRISRSTLKRWRALPAFAARVDELRAAFAAAVEATGIVDRQNRVAELNERWSLLRRIRVERGRDPSMTDVPGGTTGLLVHQRRGIGSGDNFEIVDEYALDTGLLKSMLEHERQAAQELGQWVQKVAPTDADGKTLDWASLLALARQGGTDGGDR